MTRLKHSFGLAIALLTGVSASFAAATTFSGYVVPSPAFTVGGAPAAAKAGFLANVSNVGTENFDGIAVNTFLPCADPFNPCAPENKLNFRAGLTGSVSVSGSPPSVQAETLGQTVGRFDTTTSPPGADTNIEHYLEFGATFDVLFNSAVAAFGFYATDVGDFNGALSVTVFSQNGPALGTPYQVKGACVPSATVICGDSGTENGSLLFWGIVQDAGDLILSVRIHNTSEGRDGFGIDDMMVADRQIDGPGPDVPEPASLALVGLALLGGAAARKFAKR